MRKTSVAFICTAQAEGKRTYTAFDREGKPLKAWTAGDHGHGASLCHAACAALFTISSASWTFAIANKLRRATPTRCVI